MTLMIKLMSGEDRPDSDSSKSYNAVVLGAGDTFQFTRVQVPAGKKLMAVAEQERGVPYFSFEMDVASSEDSLQAALIVHLAAKPHARAVYPLQGNAYVVSEQGKTISSFACADVRFSSTNPAKA